MKIKPPIACDMSVFGPGEKAAHERRSTDLLVRLARNVRELPNGYRFQFERSPEMFRTLADWIVDEQRCCPFFVFKLEFEPAGGGIWLELTGPRGAKDIIVQELWTRGKGAGL
jgi:hypothetical protein